ncbi:MAG: T9SS type A sorting domain-containing protein [Candidatus Kapabacteria bacterium]|nr:T9SS type A sorting domain-containing protein [Candidatus Kapabacteria bacterium]
MKIIVILIGFLIIFNNSYCDSLHWKKIDSLKNWKEDSYSTLKCVDSLNFMLFCHHGSNSWGYYFKRTTDAGKNWETVYGDTSYFRNSKDYYNITEIRDVAYPNKNLFIAVGDSGTVLRTTDQGNTWNKKTLGKNLTFFRVRMLDENYGIMVGGPFSPPAPEYYETTDGGVSWGKMNTPSNWRHYVDDLQILSRNSFVATPEITPNDYFISVKNNWQTWDSSSRSAFRWYMYFWDEKRGWIAGGDPIGNQHFKQNIEYTEDGGRTWIVQRDTNYNYEPIKDIKFYDDKFGIALGQWGCILTTTDSGKNWIVELAEDNFYTGWGLAFHSLQIVSRNTAYALRDASFIYKYTADAVDTTEVEERANLDTNFSLLPSPVSDFIKISVPKDIQNYKIEIFSIEGIKMTELFIVNNPIKIDVSNFATGLYFVKIGNKVLKFIKI